MTRSLFIDNYEKNRLEINFRNLNDMNITSTKNNNLISNLNDIDLFKNFTYINTNNFISSSYELNSKKDNQMIFQEKLFNMLEHTDFEYGIISYVDEFLIECLKKDKSLYQNYINTFYLNYYGDTKLLIKMINVLSHINLDLINPVGPTMLLGAFSHKNSEVVDNTIKAFENWFDKNTLIYLKSVSLKESWLQDDLNVLIKNLEISHE